VEFFYLCMPRIDKSVVEIQGKGDVLGVQV
jgi:hypothetical protein